MEISFALFPKGDTIKLEVEPTDFVYDVKAKIENITNIPEETQIFVYQQHRLPDDSQFQEYSISNDSTIRVVCDFYKDPFITAKRNLDSYRRSRNNIQNPYIEYFSENFDKSYIYPACKAYIKAILQIKGSRDPPSLFECIEYIESLEMKVKSPQATIEQLEKHYNYGILYKTTQKLTIRDALCFPVVIEFSTSQNGKAKILGEKKLIEKQKGSEKFWYTAFVEDYLFSDNCIICNDSNGNQIHLKLSATHRCFVTLLFFTNESIKGKIQKNEVVKCDFLEAKITCMKFKGTLYNKPIDCVWMDRSLAAYSTDYIFQYCPRKNPQLPYLGYEINQYIYIKSS